MNKEVREIVEEAIGQGWRVEIQSNGHAKCMAPNRVGIVWIAGTPSDHLWKKNTIAKMRRNGFIWPPPKK